MRSLFLLMFCGMASLVYGSEQRPQFRLWKSSQLQCGNYSNVLISSSPIIFHVVYGSAAVNGGNSAGANNYFAFFWSSTTPPTTDMSTKALIYTNQSTTESPTLGQVWDTFTISTGQFTPVYSYFSKQGGACPLYYLWDFWQYVPTVNTNFRD